MVDDARPPYRIAFDHARDPYAARNALGITSTGGGGAPTTAQYITASADATLTNERVLTNTATVTWDFSTPGQAKASTAAGGGNVSTSGTITTGLYAKWVTTTTIQSVANATVLSDIGAAPLNAPTFTGDAKAVTPAAGDNDTSIATTAFVQSTIATGVGFNCGRLQYVSATALSFKPYNGDRIKINGVVYAIPSAGITGLATTGVRVNGVAGQNLAALLYYVYAFNNAGTITADYSTTIHATSSTAGNVGTEIKSGDDTRTLIGMVILNPSVQFQDDAAGRFVLSWFNRKAVSLQGATLSAVATASTAYVVLSSVAHVGFITWGDECVSLVLSGTAFNDTAGYGSSSIVGIDGVNVGAGTLGQCYAANVFVAAGGAVSAILGEGYHYATPMGASYVGGTSYYYTAVCGSIRG